MRWVILRRRIMLLIFLWSIEIEVHQCSIYRMIFILIIIRSLIRKWHNNPNQRQVHWSNYLTKLESLPNFPRKTWCLGRLVRCRIDMPIHDWRQLCRTILFNQRVTNTARGIVSRIVGIIILYLWMLPILWDDLIKISGKLKDIRRLNQLFLLIQQVTHRLEVSASIKKQRLELRVINTKKPAKYLSFWVEQWTTKQKKKRCNKL